MRGAVEVAPRLKLAAAICDLVSTGATLEANGLAARDTVLDSQAVLIRSPVAPERELAELLDSVIERMAGDKKAEGGALTLILARGIGQAFVQKDIDPEPLAKFLVDEGA